MKKIFLILPAIAFAVLLLNGFYGHLLFASPYDQDINKTTRSIGFCMLKDIKDCISPTKNEYGWINGWINTGLI